MTELEQTPPEPKTSGVAPKKARRSYVGEAIHFMREFGRNRGALFGLSFLVILTLAAIFANVLFPGNPNLPGNPTYQTAPSLQNPLGTDDLGRSMLMLIIYGARTSLTIAFASGSILALLGTMVGLLAGYFGGVIDGALMRTADVFLTLPTLPLILVVAALLGPSLINIMIIIGVTSWPFMARLVRSNVLSMTQREFIQIERVMGASNLRIVFRHLFPNQFSLILVYTSLSLPLVILTEAAIEFLGLAPVSISWGFLLNVSINYWLAGAWWMSFFPGFAIFMTSLSFYLVSEGLKEVLTPTLKRKRDSLVVQLAERR
ncbi:MAG TPA: ABC transporter permease [Nitrososphaerales archaeon]|nr:ABC transporter permease [Nitrososphaerales archaeon]